MDRLFIQSHPVWFLDAFFLFEQTRARFSMSIRKKILILSLLVCLVPVSSSALDIQALIRDVEQQYHGSSAHALTTMVVRTAHWERSLDMESWALGQDFFMVRILAPPKERGVTTLKRHFEIWNYLPKIDRTIKVPTSMMAGSWMGSHITNDDLVKANHLEKDCDFELRRETDTVWEIAGTPRAGTAVVWGKIVYLVRKESKAPERIDYYDENQTLIRTIRFEEIQDVKGRAVPMLLTVIPHSKPGEQTVLRYRKLDFDIPVEKDDFNLRRLKQK